MGRMEKEVKNKRFEEKYSPEENFMGGVSYKLDPVDTLKMVTASSIFGEPQYYRNGEFVKRTISDGIYVPHRVIKDFAILGDHHEGKRTSEVMEEVIDNALDYDFRKTIDWAVKLRKEFYMRLNPQIIMVRAAMHPIRIEFNKENGSYFRKTNVEVMSRADEPAKQLTYFLYRYGSKQGLPSVLKRSWKDRLESMARYEAAKYKNVGIGMIDVIRICHANSPLIDELMQTGTVEFKENNSTWENLRSKGASWKEIVESINIPHMASLRNLRNIFEEIEDRELAKKFIVKLKDTVPYAKQFPFRYYTALKAIKKSEANHKPIITNGLEECMDIALDNMPDFSGKVACLTDNSGSAWKSFVSEFATTKIAEINNLSSVLTAMKSDEGYVYKFGDGLVEYPITKRNGALAQANEITSGGSKEVGGATEHGIWLFFKKAINEEIHWDTIFIYSDQQAGHGGLYGKSGAVDNEYTIDNKYNDYVDVMKLIQKYRSKVNPKVNVFTIQTAGYDNVLIPEQFYRGTALYGWTGKEILYAQRYIDLWNKLETKNQ
ncbi:MAG: TROVE domain-containing protein [archaeon]